SVRATSATRRWPWGPHALASEGADSTSAARTVRSSGVAMRQGYGAWPRASCARPPGPGAGPGRSELPDVGHAVDDRIKLRRAHVAQPLDADVGLDVDPACVDAQRAALTEPEVQAGMRGQAPGTVELEPGAGQRAVGVALFLEEPGVVHAQAEERGDPARAVEVVLQRDDRREMPCFAGLHAVEADVVLEGGRGQHLDSKIVADEVLGRDGRLDVVIDIGAQGAGEGAVVRLRIHRVEADAEG